MGGLWGLGPHQKYLDKSTWKAIEEPTCSVITYPTHSSSSLRHDQSRAAVIMPLEYATCFSFHLNVLLPLFRLAESVFISAKDRMLLGTA